jgi:hypothetical protein
MFPVLKHFRGTRERLNEIMILCCGLYNNVIRHEANERERLAAINNAEVNPALPPPN